MKVEKLYSDDFIEVRRVVDPEKGIKGYHYAHETSCNSQKVAILPFRRYENKVQFLLRQEIVPAWDISRQQLVSLTGSVEKKNPFLTVIRELHEEGGYKVLPADIIELGTCYASKALDVQYFLYSTDLTGKTKGTAIGDGSYLESIGQCIWQTKIDTNDSILSMLYLRLLRYLRRQTKRKEKV